VGSGVGDIYNVKINTTNLFVKLQTGGFLFYCEILVCTLLQGKQFPTIILYSFQILLKLLCFSK
jgi:hypothetical protein